MTSASPKKVLLNSSDTLRVYERPAFATVLPGKNVTYTAAGKFYFPAASGANGVMVVLENSNSGNDIDTAYSEDDTVPAAALQSGDQFYGFVPAGESSVSIGDLLMADDNGDFTGDVADAAGKVNTVVALEAVNNSSGSTQARIKLQVL